MKNMILQLFLLVSIATFAQNKQLKAAEREIKNQDYTAAATSIVAAETFWQSMDSDTKAKFKSLRSQIVSELYDLSSDQYRNRDYSNAAKNFYLTYRLSPQDTLFAYNAAISATLIQDYDQALNYYRELLDLGYTGISTMYFATNKETGIKENLGSKEARDIQVRMGAYQDPVEEKTAAKTGEIVKNISYILKEQGKPDEALTAIKKARIMFPNDLDLILAQADINFQLGNKQRFGELMKQATMLDPTNPDLFFNLGVISFDQGNKEKAAEYYKKAITLKEDYADAYFNLAVLILAEDTVIVEEMNNNLSNEAKYDELLKKQKGVYTRALPYLKKADEHGRSIGTVQTLMSIYAVLEMTEEEQEYTALYNRLKE